MNQQNAQANMVVKTLVFLIFWALLVAAVLSCSSRSRAQDAAATSHKTVELKKSKSVFAMHTELDPTLEKYKKALSVQMDVKKELKLALLDRIETSEGKAILMGKEKIRLEYATPSKSVAVINGQKGWVMEYPPADVQDVVRVLRFNWSKRDKNKFLIATILTSGSLHESFKLLKKSEQNGVSVFEFAPVKKDEEIKNLKISIKENKIIELEYTDPLDNKTKFSFSKVEFDKKIEPATFDLKIPKDAEVTEL